MADVYQFRQHQNRFLLNSYLSRELSMPQDIENAFSGITKAMKPIYGEFFWGMPKDYLAEALLWQPIFNKHVVYRRKDFSSWSWTGSVLATAQGVGGDLLRISSGDWKYEKVCDPIDFFRFDYEKHIIWLSSSGALGENYESAKS
jgi:hypothetical protein